MRQVSLSIQNLFLQLVFQFQSRNFPKLLIITENMLYSLKNLPIIILKDINITITLGYYLVVLSISLNQLLIFKGLQFSELLLLQHKYTLENTILNYAVLFIELSGTCLSSPHPLFVYPRSGASSSVVVRDDCSHFFSLIL